VTRVKICGVTTVDQALACAKLGADAIGVNFVEGSPRRVDVKTARAIATAVGSRALVVGVVANMSVPAMRTFVDETGVGCLQLHGDEPPGDVAALLPHAYKAVRVGRAEDVLYAEAAPGDYVLVDAKVEGMFGGSGYRLDPSLVASLAKRRRLVLAGGLTPDNVARAIVEVKPWCVDVASGVESAPGVKDIAKVRAFIEAARTAQR
jgi:phosphoribosylanthranilate isomerase